MKTPDELQAEARRQEVDFMKRALRANMEATLAIRRSIMQSTRHYSEDEIQSIIKEGKLWLAEQLFEETSK